MKYLVYCPCGHSLERHVQEGCSGDGVGCACSHDPIHALDAAVDRARDEIAVVWQRPEAVKAHIG